MFKEHKNEIIGVSIMAGAVIGAFFIIKNSGLIDPSFFVKQKVSEPVVDQRTSAEQMTLLKLSVLTKIPEIISRTSIQSSAFPQDFLNLFEGDLVKNLKTESVEYEKGSGFIANFTLINVKQKNIRDVLSDVLNSGRNASMTLFPYAYSAKVAVANLADNGYESVIEMTSMSDHTIFVHISLIAGR